MENIFTSEDIFAAHIAKCRTFELLFGKIFPDITKLGCNAAKLPSREFKFGINPDYTYCDTNNKWYILLNTNTAIEIQIEKGSWESIIRLKRKLKKVLRKLTRDYTVKISCGFQEYGNNITIMTGRRKKKNAQGGAVMSERVYEFRGLTKENKSWVYGGIFFVGTKAFIVPEQVKIVVGSLRGFIEVIPETIGQFMELYDKNNKKRYTGDIVKWRNYFGEEIIGWIRYTRSVAGFYVVLIKGGNMPFYDGNKRNFGWGELERVGNKTDNPEMMEYEYWKTKGGE